jgi:hypothetical protein
MRAACSACQNRDSVGCYLIVHFFGDAEERAGAIPSVLDVTTSSSVGCLVTDLVPQTSCNKCTSYCTALAVTFDCVRSSWIDKGCFMFFFLGGVYRQMCIVSEQNFVFDWRHCAFQHCIFSNH